MTWRLGSAIWGFLLFGWRFGERERGVNVGCPRCGRWPSAAWMCFRDNTIFGHFIFYGNVVEKSDLREEVDCREYKKLVIKRKKED